MSDASLQHVSAFNQELAALSATGLPLDIGMEGPPQAIAARLQQIDTVLADRVGRGQSLEQAVAEETQLPPRYRTALWTWLHIDNPAVALDAIAAPAEARRQLGNNLGQTMVYPLILLALTYFGFLYLCLVTAPKIEAIYGQLLQAPSNSLAFLVTARNLMPIWAPLLPLVLVLALWWWRARASRVSWHWVPGSSRYYRAMRSANFAGQLATLMEGGCSLEESLSLVGPFSESAPSQSPFQQSGSQGADDFIIDSFPPLLRWAVRGDLGGEPMPHVLRFVAQTNRQTAERQQTTWRTVAPAICGVVLGGTFVLAYGIGLFLPVVQLLKDIAVPGGS